jgi:hypothetical protein
MIGCSSSRIDNDFDNEIVRFSKEIQSYSFESIRVDKESSKVKAVDLIGSDDTIVAHLPLPETLSNEFYDIRYENDDLYFIQSVAIDDESGIVFSEDAFINMNGLYRVERIGGHTYSFATYQ